MLTDSVVHHEPLEKTGKFIPLIDKPVNHAPLLVNPILEHESSEPAVHLETLCTCVLMRFNILYK